MDNGGKRVAQYIGSFPCFDDPAIGAAREIATAAAEQHSAAEQLAQAMQDVSATSTESTVAR